jgi:type IV secretory pathway TrbL component
VVASFLFFAFIITIAIFDDPDFNEAVIYGFLVFPGLLLIFYPMAYGIQNDDDSKMLETIFGIPNYRYKVWLVRFILAVGVAFVILLVLGSIANFTLYRFNLLPMVGQVLFPIIFLSSLAFMLSTLIKNGNGTAIVIVIVSFIFFVFAEPLEYNVYNVFLNPFSEPREMSEFIWHSIIFKNRLYLIVASALCLLYGMFNLQFREKFV